MTHLGTDNALCDAVCTVAEAGAAEALNFFRKAFEVQNKVQDNYDPVTPADKAAERRMREIIEEMYPDDSILGEEYGVKQGASTNRWVLDPIDGTRGFVTGMPLWTTLVSLEVNNQPNIGAICQPYLDELWLGTETETKFKNRDTTITVHVSQVDDISYARVSGTDPRAAPQGYLTDKEAEVFSFLLGKAKVARFSMDAYAYGLLALGQLDLIVETGLKPYDISALIPVVRGAGGVVTNWHGEDSFDCGQIVAASNKKLLEQALDILKSAAIS